MEQLRGALEKKYNLEHILQVFYALAADIHGIDEAGSQGEDDSERDHKEVFCLLADRSRVATAYDSTRETTFYPLKFHPRHGNFDVQETAGFLNNLFAIMQHNMSLQNDGRDVLCFEGFPGYSSGLKRAVRHRKEDLLAVNAPRRRR